MEGKLNFPVMKQPLPEHRALSMEEYLKFVLFNLKYTVDIKSVREGKRKFCPSIQFILK